MIRKVFSAILLIFIVQLSPAQQIDNAKDSWVDSVFHSITFEQQLGQLFMVAVYSNGNEQHFDVIENLIKKYGIGGLMFMDYNPIKQIELTNRFQNLSDVPLLIGVSDESVIPNWPNELAYGATDNDSLIYNASNEKARRINLLGGNLALGPSAMIANYNYYEQTYSDSPSEVAQKSLIAMSALKDNDVLSCLKYFPGLYNDGILSNQIDEKRNKKEITQSELQPFRLLIENNVDAIIVSHAISRLDIKKIPSSLSNNTIKILKEQLGFNGLVITDALNKKIIVDEYKPGRAEVAAILAGNDILLLSPNVGASIKRIKKENRKEKLSSTQLYTSVKKILAAKYRAGANNLKKINSQNIEFKLDDPNINVLNQNVYNRSVSLVSNPDNVIPIQNLDDKKFASLSIGEGVEFTNYLDKYAFFSHYQYAGVEKLESKLALYDYVIVGLFDNNWDQKAANLINNLSGRTNVIVCSFANPFRLKSISSENTIIVSYSSQSKYQQVVPQIIFGALPAVGKLPVTLSSAFPIGSQFTTTPVDRLSFGLPEEVGMDSRIINKIDDIANEAINDLATPGCQVLVARNGKIIFNKSYGYQTYDHTFPVDDNTLYDIASITKVAATTQALMFLEGRGAIDLDKKISFYLPDLKGTNKENMILRDILTHQAGLWPFLPFWKQSLDSLNKARFYSSNTDGNFQYQISDNLYGSSLMQDSLWNWVKHSKLRTKQPRIPYDYKYSDMGYYLLLKLIEKQVNQPLAEFLQQNFYDPLGLSKLCYLPLCQYPVDAIAPTENDSYFRKTLVKGLVHDQGAAMLGGIAGHAGLFSNAIDLAKLMQMNLQNGSYGGTRYFMNGTVDDFTSVQYDNNRRGIGWDKPVIGEWNSPTSTYASKKSYGHTGFTGTAVWVDPEFQLVYVFLSNRIYPDAENRKLIKNNIRTRIQDLIYQSMWSYSAINCVDYLNRNTK